MREKIVKLKEYIEPFHYILLLLIFVGGSAYTICKLLFSPADLTIKLEKEEINYPSSINDKYLLIYSYLQDSTKRSDLKNNSIELFDFLIKTKEQRILTVKNNTDKSIKDINIRYQNVRALTSKTVSSSCLIQEELDNLFNNIYLDNSSGIVYLKNGVTLPPNGEFKIYLWGEFNDYFNSISATSNGGEAKMEYNKSFSGIKAVLAEYNFEIISFLMISFVITFYLQTKKYAIPKKNISKPN